MKLQVVCIETVHVSKRLLCRREFNVHGIFKFALIERLNLANCVHGRFFNQSSFKQIDPLGQCYNNNTINCIILRSVSGKSCWEKKMRVMEVSRAPLHSRRRGQRFRVLTNGFAFNNQLWLQRTAGDHLADIPRSCGFHCIIFQKSYQLRLNSENSFPTQTAFHNSPDLAPLAVIPQLN